MLTKIAACLSLLVACATPLPPAPDAAVGEAEQPSTSPDACHVRRYGCYPNRPGSDGVCEIACGDSHCADYGVGEYVWCELHPGQCMGYLARCCDLRGNPIWDTHCVAGPRP